MSVERLAAVQAELKKFQDSFKKENGGACTPVVLASSPCQLVPAAVRSGMYT